MIPTPPAGNGHGPSQQGAAVTLRSLARMAAAGQPFACLTCYDATTARWLERAGVHVLLVGDTAAEVILGLDRTIRMPLEVLLALTAAVKRGAPSRLVMGDMPFMSYQADEGDAMRNAARFLTEGLADVVKLEVDESFAPLVGRMVRAGIPVCGHVGSRPQRTALSGGYSAAGRTADDAEQVVRDAMAMEQAGCSLLLVEAVPPEVTRRILEQTRTPLIGIGAGAECHAQVLVLQDLLGMSDRPPRFAEPVAALGTAIQQAGEEWVRRVAARSIGGESYTMRPGEFEKLSDSPPNTPSAADEESSKPGTAARSPTRKRSGARARHHP
ncbi:MAG: 3-methyl-2-oxobutanoate hydroxymethyltransferase [Phycisphaeraceae bacterium]|nr:3-methyl-2-oxobutanoate hydroxymethyltransferase [Phycisphaeraceae bacterium]